MKIRPFNVGIIGCGLQGQRRGRALQANGDNLIFVADVDCKKAKALATEMNCEVAPDWTHIADCKIIDVVIVCSPNYLHAPMTIRALESGKHVLCEKPLARSLEEAKSMVRAAKENDRLLKCGFNHRYHPAIRQVKEWFDEGTLGELSFLRCRYGTCGRSNYERDWRTSFERAGGGELLDQGIHVLDLFRWFTGGFNQAVGFTSTKFWDIAPMEDNAFALLRTEKDVVASLHVSWTQWRNIFSFEVFGKDGYGIAEGIGGSYGVEKAILGKRSFAKPFSEQIIDYRGDDRSWHEEWKEFTSAIKEKREPMGNGNDGLEALRLVNSLYESKRDNCVVKI
ncbi:MAG: Gfo/Idh/MocA family oxidoreductase [Candidatus Bathyarchaeota archaeon]|nr:Gfo/Idh/MocA family oxidoreductase [Candidatus Bathyarchaeota archaeon]